MPSLHFILTAFGSTGDVMPLLAVGQTLRGRGHHVTLVTSGGFADAAERCDVNCVTLSPHAHYQASLRDVPLLGTRFHGLFFKRYAVAWNAAFLQAVANASPRDTVLLSSERPIVWGDLCAHLHRGLTSVRLVVDPPPAPGLPAAPSLANPRTQALLTEAWQAEWQKATAPLGIAAGARHASRLARASSRSVPRLAAWPKWLAPDAPRIAGLQPFGFLGAPTPAVPAERLDRPAGSRRLLVFSTGSLGTTGAWESRFADASRRLCEALSCDGLLLGGTPPADASAAGPFAWRKYLPLDAVLPAASALIHHGGIGTAAAALQHGVPQLIVPRVFSQPSTAEWMRRLGTALVVRPEDYRPETATARVAELLGNPAYRAAARTWSSHVDPALERSRLCDFLEDWHARRTSRGAKPVAGAQNVAA